MGSFVPKKLRNGILVSCPWNKITHVHGLFSKDQGECLRACRDRRFRPRFWPDSAYLRRYYNSTPSLLPPPILAVAVMVATRSLEQGVSQRS
jgi:hypothetical protein